MSFYLIQTHINAQNKNIKQGDTINIVGYAQNLKMGATVLTTDNIRYFIDKLPSWDKTFYGKKVNIKLNIISLHQQYQLY